MRNSPCPTVSTIRSSPGFKPAAARHSAGITIRPCWLMRALPCMTNPHYRVTSKLHDIRGAYIKRRHVLSRLPLNPDDMATKRGRLGDVNEAFRAMKTGEVARTVLTFE